MGTRSLSLSKIWLKLMQWFQLLHYLNVGNSRLVVDFTYFIKSLEMHADCYIWYASYDFLLVFSSDLRSSWNHCRVTTIHNVSYSHCAKLWCYPQNRKWIYVDVWNWCACRLVIKARLSAEVLSGFTATVAERFPLSRAYSVFSIVDAAVDLAQALDSCHWYVCYGVFFLGPAVDCTVKVTESVSSGSWIWCCCIRPSSFPCSSTFNLFYLLFSIFHSHLMTVG